MQYLHYTQHNFLPSQQDTIPEYINFLSKYEARELDKIEDIRYYPWLLASSIEAHLV
jgi:hypothetical protein